MRDVGQPCGQVWKQEGPGAAIEMCQSRSELCSEFTHHECDLDGFPQTCAVQLWVEKLKKKVGIEPRELGLLLNDRHRVELLRPERPLAYVESWLLKQPMEGVEGKIKGCEMLLALGGSRGVGKTVAACVALSRFNRGMPSGKYIRADEIVEREAPLRDLAKEALLVVDQCGHEWFGKEDGGAWAKSQWLKLLDRRYAGMRPTILVGNIKADTFTNRYGSIIDDRLQGDGAFLFFDGPSLRRSA